MSARIGGALLVFLPLFLVRAPAHGASPAPNSPAIHTVTHDARAPLRAGAPLTVRVTGTAGGVARFTIAGVAAGIGMRALRSDDEPIATYVGTYVVRPGEAAQTAAITATLRAGGQDAVRTGGRRVVIDGRGPEILHRLPARGAAVANLRPNVVLRFHDGESGVNRTGVRLLINGRDVTGRAVITSAFAAYTPAEPLPVGPVRVQVAVPDRAGNMTRAAWTFTIIRPRGLIDSVTVSPAAGARPGDILTVVVVGAPGGRASFTPDGEQQVPMRESPRAPGRYVGLHPVGRGDRGRLLQVTARLRKGTRASAARAAGPIPVLGPTPRPVVASAELVSAGQEGAGQVTARGSARRATRVVVTVSDRLRTATGRTWSPILAAATPVSEGGRWELALEPLVAEPRAELFLTAVAIDHLGQRSPPAVVALARVSPTTEDADGEDASTGEAAADEEPAVTGQAPVPPPPSTPPAPAAAASAPPAGAEPASCSPPGGSGGASGCGAVEPTPARSTPAPSTPAPSDPKAGREKPKGHEKPKDPGRKEPERKERGEKKDRDDREDRGEQEKREGKDDD